MSDQIPSIDPVGALEAEGFSEDVGDLVEAHIEIRDVDPAHCQLALEAWANEMQEECNIPDEWVLKSRFDRQPRTRWDALKEVILGP